MIVGCIISAIAGAVVFGLVLRNNPKLGAKLGVIVDKIEEIDVKEIDVKPSTKKIAKK